MPAESPIGAPSDDTLKLEAYISTKKHGDVISYQELIDMIDVDVRLPHNRGKFYSACRRLKREVTNMQKYGYRLSCCDTAIPIVNGKLNRVISGTRRMVKSVDNLGEHHGADLTPSQKDVLTNSKYAGNAIMGSARSAKKIVRREVAQITEASPHA